MTVCDPPPLQFHKRPAQTSKRLWVKSLFPLDAWDDCGFVNKMVFHLTQEKTPFLHRYYLSCQIATVNIFRNAWQNYKLCKTKFELKPKMKMVFKFNFSKIIIYLFLIVWIKQKLLLVVLLTFFSRCVSGVIWKIHWIEVIIPIVFYNLNIVWWKSVIVKSVSIPSI